MLCLTRRIGEEILIEVPPSTTTTTIRVTVLKNPDGGTRIRLGFEAPKYVDINRAEVWERRGR